MVYTDLKYNDYCISLSHTNRLAKSSSTLKSPHQCYGHFDWYNLKTSTTTLHIFLFFLKKIAFIHKYFALVITCLVMLFSSTSALLASDTHTLTSHQATEEIRVAMSAAFVSQSGIDIYERIFKYIGKKLGHNITFISGFSYSTINSMLDSGMVDIGFICGLPYIMKKILKIQVLNFCSHQSCRMPNIKIARFIILT